MDQCDSIITKLITMLLDWYSGDINTCAVLINIFFHINILKIQPCWLSALENVSNSSSPSLKGPRFESGSR